MAVGPPNQRGPDSDGAPLAFPDLMSLRLAEKPEDVSIRARIIIGRNSQPGTVAWRQSKLCTPLSHLILCRNLRL